jgi:hypothetical protein
MVLLLGCGGDPQNQGKSLDGLVGNGERLTHRQREVQALAFQVHRTKVQYGGG